MERHNEVPQQSSPDALSQPGLTQPRRLAFLIFITLAMVTLACAYFGPRSPLATERIVHLPTLTRTPLPTLSPTLNPTAVAATMVAQTTAAPPISVPAGASGNPLPSDAAGASNPPAPAADDPATDAAPLPPNPTTTAPNAVAVNAPTATGPLPTTEPLPPTTTPTPTATEPLATPTPAEIPTATPLPEGWGFTAVRAAFDPDEEGLVLHGELVNNTDAAKELTGITGTFYDEQGQVIADGDTADHWPVAAVAPRGRVPFELLVPDLMAAANFDLRVDSKGSNSPPRQDFEFLDVRPTVTEPDYYCVTGTLRNSGDNLMSYLVVVDILYDDQDNILDFGAYTVFYPRDLTNGRTRDFEICANPAGQPVARHELRAWGL